MSHREVAFLSVSIGAQQSTLYLCPAVATPQQSPQDLVALRLASWWRSGTMRDRRLVFSLTPSSMPDCGLLAS